MTQPMTPSELKGSELEIRDEPRDTPLPTVVALSGYRILRGFTATTEILNPSHSALNDYVLTPRNMTGPSEDELLREAEPEATVEESPAIETPYPPVRDAEIANRDRLELLARAYVAGKLSPEEDARLAIVTERVRRLIPRVVIADFEKLENIAEDVRRIDEEDDNLRRRLGLL